MANFGERVARSGLAFSILLATWGSTAVFATPAQDCQALLRAHHLEGEQTFWCNTNDYLLSQAGNYVTCFDTATVQGLLNRTEAGRLCRNSPEVREHVQSFSTCTKILFKNVRIPRD